MSRKIVTSQPTGEHLQRKPGGTITFRDDGRAIYRESFYLADPARLETGILPQRGVSAHPDFSEPICSNVSCQRSSDGGWNISVEYETGSSTGSIDIGAISSDGVLEVVASVASESIETHPDFATASMAGTQGSPANGAIFDSDKRFTGWKADSDFAGVDSYLVPTVIAQHSYADNSKPSQALLGNIGSIQVPGHSDIVTPEGRDWLLSHVSYSRSGDAYEIMEEYTLSGPNGWNSDIYDYA